MNELLLAVKAHLEAGNSVVPVNWRTKAALATWKAYQSEPPSMEKWREWIRERETEAFAVICGYGGREIIDIDNNVDVDPGYSAEAFLDPWLAEVGDIVMRYPLPILKTGGHGYQIGYRTEAPSGNLKLAWVPAPGEKSGRKIAIETRGVGGYHIGECSKHPSGNRYVLLQGDLVNPPWIPPDERDRLLTAARRLCRMPESRQEAQARAREYRHRTQRAAGVDSPGASVIDAYNTRYSIVECLERYGYLRQGARYIRPGGHSASVTVYADQNISFHFSSNDPLNRTNGAGSPLPADPFDLFAFYEHGDDLRAAVRTAAELLDMAYPRGQPAGNGAEPESDFSPPPQEEPSASRGREICIWSVADLLTTQFPELEWVIPGILAAGLYILAGRPKLGKSWLALQWAVAIATGGMVFGQSLTARRVLYLALEDNERRLQERMQTLGCPATGQLDFITAWPQIVDHGIDKLMKLIAARGYTVVVVDTLARISRTRRKDQEAMIAEGIDALQRFAGEQGVTVLLVYHHRKAGLSISDLVDDVMGSTFLTGAADGILGLYRGRGQRSAELRMTGRDLPERELALEFDHNLSCWQFKGEADDVRSGSLQEKILEVLASDFDGGATVSELAAALERHRENVRKELEELVKKGKAERAGVRGRQVLYRRVSDHSAKH